MAAQNTISTLDGLFKEVYGSSLVNLLPDFAILSRKVPFRPSERIGEGFAIPVKLQHEHGFTYGASGDGAFTLKASVAGKIGKAIVNSAQIVLKSQMDYESAFKATAGGKQAFMDASQAMVENMMESFAKRQELAFLYGASPTGLGTVSSNSVAADNLSATLTISDATWAAGTWVGMKNARLDVYADASNSSSQHGANSVTISAVNISAKELTVNCAATGTMNLFTGADDLVFHGALGKECKWNRTRYCRTVAFFIISMQSTMSCGNLQSIT